MNIKLYAEYCRYSHFIRYLRLRLNILEHQLQGPLIIRDSDRKGRFAKEVKEELLHPAVFNRIHIDLQTYFQKLQNVLISELADR